MEISKKSFPKKMLDNDENFIAHMEGVLSSIDELASLEITKLPTSYKVRIAPSHPMYTHNIITELLQFFNNFKIRVDMGKSIKTTAVITFNIILH